MELDYTSLVARCTTVKNGRFLFKALEKTAVYEHLPQNLTNSWFIF